MTRPSSPRVTPHSYTDEEMERIHQRIRDRDPTWLEAVWDPILLETHGFTMAEAAERSFEVHVGLYAIPSSQSTTISGWLADMRGGFRFTWLSYGPHPAKDDNPED